jgi:hypothetical protein
MNGRPSSGKVGPGWVILAALPVLLAGMSPRGAEPETSSATAASAGGSGATFAAFKSIGDRNIFDRNRKGRTNADPLKPPVEMFSLVGTMQSESGPYAFFNSPDSAYRKALQVGSAIAQFTVRYIAPDRVELERGSRSILLGMGQQLSRSIGGDWTVVSSGAAGRPNVETKARVGPEDDPGELSH